MILLKSTHAHLLSKTSQPSTLQRALPPISSSSFSSTVRCAFRSALATPTTATPKTFFVQSPVLLLLNKTGMVPRSVLTFPTLNLVPLHISLPTFCSATPTTTSKLKKYWQHSKTFKSLRLAFKKLLLHSRSPVPMVRKSLPCEARLT